MLSYRHAFHAGNYADVHKHITLCKTLEYLLKKTAPIVYIDTHAGAGKYTLTSKLAEKTNESKEGIGALDFSCLPESLRVYQDIVADDYARQQYPGSPLLAASMLRSQDKLRLFELHTSDYPLLQKLFENDKRVRVSNTDGAIGPKALLPVKQARALILIDPSYEIKKDFQGVVDMIKQIYKRMSTAHILLWYPVVDRKRVDSLLKNICDLGVRDVWRYELGIKADCKDYGMTASGMLAINPPWVLAEQMNEILPAIARQFVQKDGFYKVEHLVEE